MVSMAEPAATPSPTSSANAALTPAETAHAVAELERTRAALLADLPAPGDARWQARTDGTGWSVAQILEHLGIVERRVVVLLEKMLTQPPEADWEARTAHQTPLLPRTAVADEKIVAPELLDPKGGKDTAALTAEFEAARAAVIELVRRPGLRLKEHTRDHPVLGTLNGYQWALVTAYHGERHRAQMRRCLL